MRATTLGGDPYRCARGTSTVPAVQPIVTIGPRTIAAPPGAFAFIDDDHLGRWVTDLGEAQLLALHHHPQVRWVDVAPGGGSTR